MKYLLTLCCILLTVYGYSQDNIFKKDGTEIKAKVTDILDDVIKYKKFDNPDGPTYSIATKDVTKIKYANGSEEVYNATVENDYAAKPETKTSNGDKFDVEDEQQVKQVEAIAKEAGETILARCANKLEFSTTEVYFDGVYRDQFTKELVIPIKITWQTKMTGSDSRWIRGTVKVTPAGSKTWHYQNDSGGMFRGCAKSITTL